MICYSINARKDFEPLAGLNGHSGDKGREGGDRGPSIRVSIGLNESLAHCPSSSGTRKFRSTSRSS